MQKRIFELKTSGLYLFLAALSIMAFTAADARGEGHVFVDLELLTETVEVEALKPIDGTLLTTFGVAKVDILCEAILLHDGLLFSDGSSLGEVLFSSCATVISGLTKANCKPLEPIVLKVKNSLTSHNGDTYILVSPKSGLVLTILHFGELCAMAENVEITGHFVAECGLLSEGSWSHEDCATETQEHEVRQASAGLFQGHQIKFGARSISLDGEIKLNTAGNHANLKWGIQDQEATETGSLLVNLGLLNTNAGVQAVKPIAAELLSSVGEKKEKVQISCEEILIHNGIFEPEGGGSGEVLLSKCRTLLGLVLSEPCKPLEPIVTKVKGLPVHHSNDTYILISPQSGSVFATVHLGESCSIGKSFEVKGELVAECGLLLEESGPPLVWHHEDCSTEKVSHEVRQAPQALFPGDQLEFGERAATLDGDIRLSLKTPHGGAKWGIQAVL